MKKNYLVFVTLLAFCALGNVACKKSSGSSKSKTELITQSAWKYDAMGPDLNNDGQVDMDQLDDCNNDDTITFNVNGTGSTSQGTDVCPNSSATSTWNWNFTSNETIVHIDIAELGDINLTSLTETQLSGYKNVDMGGGVIWKVVIKLKH